MIELQHAERRFPSDPRTFSGLGTTGPSWHLHHVSPITFSKGVWVPIGITSLKHRDLGCPGTPTLQPTRDRFLAAWPGIPLPCMGGPGGGHSIEQRMGSGVSSLCPESLEGPRIRRPRIEVLNSTSSGPSNARADKKGSEENAVQKGPSLCCGGSKDCLTSGTWEVELFKWGIQLNTS